MISAAAVTQVVSELVKSNADSVASAIDEIDLILDAGVAVSEQEQCEEGVE